MKRLTMTLVLISMVLYSAIAQTTPISGKVTAADGQPLPGTSVVVKGTTIGTVSDAEGNYVINVPQGSNTLVFSFVGMRTTEIALDGKTSVDVTLAEDVIGMDEVVVVAFGTTTRSSFTGAASSVSSEKIEKQQVSSISKALQGSVSGVQVVNTSGQPGTDATIRIRGIGSVNSSSAPLYVVDGVPFMGNINSINPADIESISIGKDAVSTSLYGSRAANGIVIITTKKGKKGETRIDLKAQYGVSKRAIPEYDRVDIQDYYELSWEALKNNYFGLKLSDGTIVDENMARQFASEDVVDQLGGYNLYNVSNDQLIDPATGKLRSGATLKYQPENWEDAIFQTGKRQEYQLSMQGGSEKTDYYFSFGYLKDEGIVKRSDFDRYSARLNVNNQAKNWLKIGMNIGASTTAQNFPQSSGTAYANVFMYSRMIAPIYPVYVHDSEGKLVLDANQKPQFDFGSNDAYDQFRTYASNTNPAGTTVLDRRTRSNDNVSARTYAEFSFLKNFKFTTNISVDYIGFRGLDFQNPEFGDGQVVGGRAGKEDTRRLYNNFNQLLTYQNSLGYHNFNFLVGHESYMLKRNYMYAERTSFVIPGIYELSAASTASESTSVEDNYRTEGYLGRFEYNFNDRYYLSASFRRDGTSRFSKDTRWGNFYSVGASWRISQEDFMQSVGAVNLLKIKGSYGTKGNDGTDSYYSYQGLYGTGYNNNSAPGLFYLTLPSPELKWESKRSLNIGLELGIFNRVNFDLNYFNDYSADLLFQLPLPISTGFKYKWENIGDMKNTGIELDINSVLMKSEKLTWNLNLNFTHFRNEVTKLPQDQILDGIQQLEVGHSRYEFYTRDYAGVDPNTGASLWYYDELAKDANGNVIMGSNGKPQKTGKRLTTGTYASADRYYVGTALPDFYGGLTNTIQAYGFDFSIFFAYSLGGKVFDSNYQSLMHGGQFGDNWHKDILNRWTPDNKNTDVPSLDAGNTDINQSSSRFLVDGSYLVLRNLTLGYTIPVSVTNKWQISSIRAFVSGDNILSFTKRKGLDPSSDISGITGFDYVPVQTISFGINASF